MKKVIHSYDELLNVVERLVEKNLLTFQHPYTFEIKPYKPPRTLPQNAKLHAMIGVLANHIGYGSSELKDWLKLEYGPKKRFEYGEHVSMIPKSTAAYTKTEMIAFIDQGDMIAAEAGYRFEHE